MNAKRRFSRCDGLRKFESMIPTEAAYIAAIIDGEGCITAYHHERSYCFPRINIGMTSDLPRKLWEEWGGAFCVAVQPEGCKAKNIWDIAKQNRILALIIKVKPYLRVKAKQADIALKMLEILNVKTPDWKEELNRLGENMHKLNKRGTRE